MRTFEVIYREAGHAEVVRKEIKSIAEALVRHDLESQGCQVLAILARRDNGVGDWLKRVLSGENIKLPSLRFGVSTAELALFCEILKALYSSGVPMLQSLQMVIDETPNPWFRKRLVVALDRLRDGADIHEALSDERCRKAFPPLMRETIRTGEANGRLDRSLERLVEIFKRAAETKRETISALLYPAVAVIVFIAVCTVIAIMVPNSLREAVDAETLQKNMHKIPRTIRLLFYLRDNPKYLAMPPVLLAVPCFSWAIGKRYHATRVALTRIERKIALIGAVLYQFALVRFLDLLASNNETGIQISESLRLIQGSVNDALIEDSLVRMRERILTEGAGLGQAMSDPEEADVFPGIVKQMVRAGEESGRLTEMLLPVVAFYGDQARATLKRTLDMLTPVMIILLGSVITPVLLGIYKTLLVLNEAQAGLMEF